jgi:hypothetical protein
MVETTNKRGRRTWPVSPFARAAPAPRYPDPPGASRAPRRVDDADLHTRPEPWPIRRAQPAGRNAGCVISPPFRPGYPTRYTAAPRWIAKPAAAGGEPVSRQNYGTAGTRTGERARCYTPPRCSVWGATLVSVFTDRIVVRRIGGASTALVFGFGYPDCAAECSLGGADVGGQRQTESP